MLHAHVLVPGPVLVQVAFGSQPPWLILHESTAAQDAPVPEYPVLQVQVLVPGPVDAQVAFGSQPPRLTLHESIAAQVVPFPEYPVLQVQVTAELTTAHAAFRLQPPLFVPQDGPTAASAPVTGLASAWTSALAPASTRSPAPPPVPGPPLEPPPPAPVTVLRAVVHPSPIIASATRPAATTNLIAALGFENGCSLAA